MITLDTSAVVSLLNRDDPDNERVAASMFGDVGPYLVPAATIGEIACLVEQRWGAAVLDAFLGDLEEGLLTYECGDDDLPRARELAQRYADMPLGFVDAAVIACGERNGGKVLTLDRRDFEVVAREGTITLLP